MAIRLIPRRPLSSGRQDRALGRRVRRRTKQDRRRGASANETDLDMMSQCRTGSSSPRPPLSRPCPWRTRQWPSGFHARPRTPPSPAAPSPAFASDGTSSCREPPSTASLKRTVGHQTSADRRPRTAPRRRGRKRLFRVGQRRSVAQRQSPALLPPVATDLGRRVGVSPGR